MKVLRYLGQFSLALVVCLGVARADSIQLRNGRHLQGKYIGGTSTSIGFLAGTNVEYFSTSDVLVLVFDSGNDSTMRDLQPNPMKGKSVSPRSGARLVRASTANGQRTVRSNVLSSDSANHDDSRSALPKVSGVGN
jgi:hypothetical protein